MRFKDLINLFRLPKVTIYLMHDKTRDNDPFYARLVEHFYEEARAPHSKLPFARQYQLGFAVNPLPENFEAYFMQLDSSARNNFRKALRKGYEVRRIRYNDHLEEIRRIWMSCTVRQGILPRHIREGNVRPIEDPPSQSRFHDYVYLGVFHHNQLVAYSGCLIAGELCSITDLFGHAEHLEYGVVPLLFIENARQIFDSHPNVRYYAYGTYFGAAETLRRFKRKFHFFPHRVTWSLGNRPLSAPETSPVKSCVS
jgi:hypothetical protein